MSDVQTAVLLCAGRGKRLRPHTDTVPKPLLPVDGQPTLAYTLQSLRQAGIKQICMVTHHLAEQVVAYAASQLGDGFTDVVCVHQPALAGTADALLCAVDALPGWFDEPFVLAATDYIVPQAFYPDLLAHHRENKASITISLKALPENELSGRSSIRFDQQQRVLEVVEKPAPGTAPSSIAANLVFVLPADIIADVRQVLPSARGESEVQSAVNAYIEKHGPAYGLVQSVPMEWQPPA